jgi:lipoic acid synthetase
VSGLRRVIRHKMGEPRVGKPHWLRVPRRSGENYFDLRRLMRSQRLHTICEEARCPNTAECWNARTATFLVLGDRCTRRCTFCNVGYGWTRTVDADEPRRLAATVQQLRLRHVVITSVDRDDLPDGGSGIFVQCVEHIRDLCPDTRIELLIPDFAGKPGALAAVLAAAPDVLAHNLETVAPLYPGVRPRSSYAGSLDVLREAARARPRPRVKTGIMVGLGETRRDLLELFADVAAVGVDILTLGQYLQPSVAHHRVERFVSPAEFERLARAGRRLGIAWVEAGPLVRSSYHAAAQSEALG